MTENSQRPISNGTTEEEPVPRILVVDDELYHLKAIQRLFRADPVTVKTAGSGREALGLIHGFHPDIVLLDINMPGMDGYEVCQRIKTDDGLKRTLVMMLSARSELDDRLNGYQAKADDYMTKPYDPAELKAKVGILLRLKLVQDKLAALNGQLAREVEKQSRALVRQERQRLIGQMIQGIAHNLKGPLTVIDGNVSIAEFMLDNPDAEKVSAMDITGLKAHLRKCLEQIAEGSKRAARLVQNLLVAGGKADPGKKTDIQLNDVIRREVAFMKTELTRRHGISVQFNPDHTLPTIKGHEIDFSQMVYIFLKNSMDAMADSPARELTITTAQTPKKEITIIFSDTGCGISAADQERIFEPFFTTKSTSSDPRDATASGTGMGLYFCRQMVASYSGTVTLRSEEGQGATFVISLPVTETGL